jgi:hypothetical protein
MVFNFLKQGIGLIIGGLLVYGALSWMPVAHATPNLSEVSAPQAAVVTDSLAAAQVLHYQGHLLAPDTGQAKPDGTYPMTFSIYNVNSGGSALWTETKNVGVSKGLFATLLGDTTPLDLAMFNGQELWLGIKVDPDPEATPRQRMAHVAYAMRAENAGNAELLNGLDSTAFATAGHTHDGSEITSGTVEEARIDPAIARVSDIVPHVLSNDGSGSGLDADLLDGHDSSEFYPHHTGTQYQGALNPGQSTTVFTFGWPTSWYVHWYVLPTTMTGQVTWSVKTELGSDGNITYYITITNAGSIATNYDMKFVVLR